MNENPVPEKFRVVKQVLLKDKNDKRIGVLRVGTILLVINRTRHRKQSIMTAEIYRAEVVQANEKKVHGFCFTHDYRGNVMIEEVGNSNEEKLDSKEEEALPTRALRRVHVLSESLNAKQMDDLVRDLEERSYRKGEVIMKEGGEGTELFVVKRGRAQISASGDNIGILVPGDYIGEQVVTSENSFKWVQTVTAITDVQCLVATQKMLKEVLHTEQDHLGLCEERVAFSTKRSRRETITGASVVYPQGKQIDFIKQSVSDTTLFAGLTDPECIAVIKKMKLQQIEPFKIVIKEGDCDGVKFYVISKGAFDITANGKSIRIQEEGTCFGERALIQDAPRSATVRSQQPSEVWVLHRDDYRDTVAEEARKERDRLLYFIKTLKTFEVFGKDDLLTLAETFEEVKYKEHDRIIRQGDEGDRFYVIMNGIAHYAKKDKKGRITAQGDLIEGKYFGELALSTGHARAASVFAKSDLTCLVLSKVDFDNLLKPLEKVFEDKAKTYMEITKKVYRRKSLIECGLELKTVEDYKVEDDVLLKIDTPLKDLQNIGLLGKGAFGLVTLVLDPASETKFALKAIRKHDIVQHSQVGHVVNEKDIQQSLRTPFCVKLYRTYKDEFRIYFLLEACTGGDIFTILRKRRNFNEKVARFYAACIIAAFDHMHGKNIIYRDLKPENLVMDHTGYCKLTDFGFAKICLGKTNTVCGTPDYLAPEVIIGRGHGRGVDFWTLGIFIYESINGVAPFYARKDMDTYRKILRKNVSFPKSMSEEVKDLISKLLKKRAARRLGIRKGDDIHEQPFYMKSKWNWEKFLKLQMKSPYTPKKLALKDPNIPRYKLFDKDIACPLQEFEEEF